MGGRTEDWMGRPLGQDRQTDGGVVTYVGSLVGGQVVDRETDGRTGRDEWIVGYSV
jgi:hypothetical protein